MEGFNVSKSPQKNLFSGIIYSIMSTETLPYAGIIIFFSCVLLFDCMYTCTMGYLILSYYGLSYLILLWANTRLLKWSLTR